MDKCGLHNKKKQKKQNNKQNKNSHTQKQEQKKKKNNKKSDYWEKSLQAIAMIYFFSLSRIQIYICSRVWASRSLDSFLCNAHVY